jgi:hypothetical protein
MFGVQSHTSDPLSGNITGIIQTHFFLDTDYKFIL